MRSIIAITAAVAALSSADAGAQTLLSTDFEQGLPPGWFFNTPAMNLWHVASPGECGATTNVLAYNEGAPSCDYDNGPDAGGQVISEIFMFPGTEDFRLSFRYVLDVDGPQDDFRIKFFSNDFSTGFPTFTVFGTGDLVNDGASHTASFLIANSLVFVNGPHAPIGAQMVVEYVGDGQGNLGRGVFLDDLVLEVDPGGVPIGTSYCISAPNSTGSAALIGAFGSTSVSANSVNLQATGCPPAEFGLFFYGPDQTQVPLANGFRCVGPGALGLFRLPVAMSDANGILATAYDLTQPPQPAGTIVAGSTWNFQAWYRDPGAGGGNANLSDGLEITFIP